MFRIILLIIFFSCVIYPIFCLLQSKLIKKDIKNNLNLDIYNAFKSLSNFDEKFIKKNEQHIKKLMQSWHSYSEDIFDKMKNIEKLNNKN